MLEAFQSLQDKLTKKQAEVDQTSASASKPGPSTSAVNLDLPPPRPRTTSHVQEMEVDYGPTLPPHLGSDLHYASDQNSNASEELLLLLLCIYTQRNISIYYRTQSAI